MGETIYFPFNFSKFQKVPCMELKENTMNINFALLEFILFAPNNVGYEKFIPLHRVSQFYQRLSNEFDLIMNGLDSRIINQETQHTG